MEIGQWIVIGLSVILGIWFVAGYYYNRRKSLEVYRWLRAGIAQLGEINETNMVKTSGLGVRFLVKDANAPFRRVEIGFLLQPRENLLFWLYRKMRGAHDEVNLSAVLRNAPSQEFEAISSQSRSIEQFLAMGEKEPFSRLPAYTGFDLARRGNPDPQELDRLKTFLKLYPDALKRVSVRRKSPHIQLHFHLQPLEDEPAEKIFLALKEWLF